MKRYCLAPAFLLVFLIGGCSPHLNLNAPFGSRPPNGNELFYTAVAANFGDSKMCEKISKRALDESGPDMGSTEWRVIVQRSACYFYVALKAKNTKLCDSVKKIVTLPSNGAGISKSGCREILQKNLQYGYQPSPDYYSVGDFMKEMGYREEDFYAAEYAENSTNNSIFRFYATIRNTESFKTKVWNLPSYDEPYSPDKLRPANDDEMLTQMFAVENSIPESCRKISPNSYVEGPAGLPWSWEVPPKVALRNACFFSVAQNTHRSALCANIVPLGANAIGVSSATQQSCETQLKVQVRDNRWRGYYPPAYFQTMAPFLRVLQKLDYAKPFLSNNKAVDWSHFYSYLEFEAPLEQKQEFLKRAEALPSFTD